MVLIANIVKANLDSSAKMVPKNQDEKCGMVSLESLPFLTFFRYVYSIFTESHWE